MVVAGCISNFIFGWIESSTVGVAFLLRSVASATLSLVGLKEYSLLYDLSDCQVASAILHLIGLSKSFIILVLMEEA